MDRATLEATLNEFGCPFEEMSDGESEFNLAVSFPGAGNTLHIIAKKDDPHHYGLAVGLKLSDALWTRVRQSDPKLQRQMVARAKQLLLLSNVQYILRKDQEADSMYRGVTVFLLVDRPTLDRARLEDAMWRTRNSALLFGAAHEEFAE
jgi:hypothetical protein